VTKKYQIKDANTNDALELAVPATVNVAMNEIAADMREGLLALAVGAGLQVMGALMDADVAALAGPRGRHDPDRTATRHGTEAGSVTLGGRRVSVTRPRVRTVDGTGELAVPSYELFSSTEILEDGNGADAGRALDPPLPGWARAGRRAGQRVRQLDQQVGGLPQVRGDDRACAGRPARGGPVHPGPGRVHGRRGALRRVVLRGRARDRHRRDQAPAGAGRGLDRERHAGHRADRRVARAGPGRHPAGPGGAGRVQGAAPGGPGRV